MSTRGSYNVLLIQVDQMNAQCLGILGNPNVRTPNLDGLARAGTLLSGAACNSPICMPSRASMLSGQYVSTLRQYGFGGLCDRRTPWLQGLFRRAGYRTGAFGKFHVDCIGEDQWDFERAAPDLPEDVDFARPGGWTYEQYCRQHGVPWIHPQMHGHIPFKGHYSMTDNVPSTATPEMHPYIRAACRSDIPVEHSVETWETDQCIRGLQQWHAEDDARPFFAWLTYLRPHCPTPLPEPWFSRIRPDELVLSPLPSAEELATWPRTLFSSLAGPSLLTLGEKDFRFMLATYFTLIEYIDSEIGRVLNTLRRLGWWDTTLVVFTSDHGDDAGYRGQYDKFGIFSYSEGVTNVPLIVILPPALAGSAAGRRLDEPVELVDLAPTLLSLCGLDVPERMDGRDLSRVLRQGDPLDAHRPVFCEEERRRMIKQDNWRLLFDGDYESECMLVDLNADPNSVRNLYGSAEPSVQDRRIELKRQLLAFLMQREHGPYAATDIERIRKGLDPSVPTLPIRFPGGAPNCWSFRSAAGISLDDRYLLAPYFDDPMLLFSRARGAYQQGPDALPMDAGIAERMLNWALRALIARVHPVSVNAPLAARPPAGPPVTLDEARAVLRRRKS